VRGHDAATPCSWLLRKDGWRTRARCLVCLFSPLGYRWHPCLSESRRAHCLNGANRACRNDQVVHFTRPFLLLVTAIFLYSVSFNGLISHVSAMLTDRGISLGTSAQHCRDGCVWTRRALDHRLFTGQVFAVRVSLLLFTATAAGVIFLSLNSTPSAFFGSAIIDLQRRRIGHHSYLLSRYFSLQRFSTLYGMAWTHSLRARR